MKTQIYGLSLGVGALLLATQHAFANTPNCAERAQIINRLAEGFGETRQSYGLGQNNSFIELFASEETGTWTLTVTMANGKTCLVASGHAYEEDDQTLKPTGLAI